MHLPQRSTIPRARQKLNICLFKKKSSGGGIQGIFARLDRNLKKKNF